MNKREVDLVVLSDVHLGTYGCHAKELLCYLKSIKPKKILLNGDIIDIWQFSKRYWPESHMKVIRKILKFVAEGTPVTYLTGNHDEMLRKFADFQLGSLTITNKLSLRIGKKRAWVFHGDIFDVTMQHAKWLARLGAIGYDTLILLNSLVNWILTKLGREKMSLSKKIKNSIKNAVKFINDFEVTAATLAIEKGYQYVICGHIHQPAIRQIQTERGTVTYLNSGDWIENLTALEYHKGNWQIYRYHPAEYLSHELDPDTSDNDNDNLDGKLDIKRLLDLLKSEPTV
ncbi:UDP-2,3-diacylglucosamine diphosphatase [Parapedobacter indicus]|uniref:UDP-2,3-diacylglucosamine pyrophosphatase LpxH n=1 Tax=Parapedobacter indicus TaxID=1477437 RepID=A0A1I3GXT5_9SPHI|nr:UDP-2,3-diacylglucosamine diphosphatase [Parapedobacter indicus]PPL02821.1 UDP-2,3-diacylglucosamine pyrophosphatase LpxH [Parapedobacter indicus]SFI28176.1 UDP-2,3-diacylglucosamine pyrophosphatase LpxH [Parapedobacter indicus]